MIHKTCFGFVCVVIVWVRARVSFYLCLYSFSSLAANTHTFLFISFFFHFLSFSPFCFLLFCPLPSLSPILILFVGCVTSLLFFKFWFVLLSHHFSLRFHFGSSREGERKRPIQSLTIRLVFGHCVCVSLWVWVCVCVYASILQCDFSLCRFR